MSKTTTLAKPTLVKFKSDAALAFAEAGAVPETTGAKQAAAEIWATNDLLALV